MNWIISDWDKHLSPMCWRRGHVGCRATPPLEPRHFSLPATFTMLYLIWTVACQVPKPWRIQGSRRVETTLWSGVQLQVLSQGEVSRVSSCLPYFAHGDRPFDPTSLSAGRQVAGVCFWKVMLEPRERHLLRCQSPNPRGSSPSSQGHQNDSCSSLR
jgi:hypothetical protein